MGSKYTDIPAIVQVLGNIYQNPNLLDDEKYHFYEEDFTEDFHKIIFGTIYNLHILGAKEITLNTIEDYLTQRPNVLGIYHTNKGNEWLTEIAKKTQLSTFDYYYGRIKKMTLLRMYYNAGLDLSWLYDPDNILDVAKKKAQEDWLDNNSLESIAEKIDKRISDIKLKYVDGANDDFINAGEGISELIEQLQQRPDCGYPMYGPIINTITRGARLGKFYLRSAATGVGKTRGMIADACYIACDKIFDKKNNEWKQNNGGKGQPTLFITTEQEIDEIQTMILAFVANVDEDHIIYNKYEEGEFERVKEAADILKRSPLHIKKLPDFSLQDVENTIKYSIREWDTRYIFFDYLHTSMKILSEVSSKTGIKGLREDNILFMMSIKLKDICVQEQVFIMTATQLNSKKK